MRLMTLISLLSVATLAQAWPYCGTVTDTITKTRYSTEYAPTVTSIHTRKIPVCYETEHITKTKTKHARSTEYETTTKHHTHTTTETAYPIQTTVFKTRVIPTCTSGGGGYKFHKRSFVEGSNIEERELEGLTNAERIQRGLPLSRPNQIQKRQNVDVDAEIEVDAQGRKKPRPSCYPTHIHTTVYTTKDKTQTPTKWETTTKCAWTKTVDDVVYTRTTITDVHTHTVTERGEPVIITTEITPTRTHTSTITSRTITGECRPTHY
ncbi:uncharacterized protein I206_105398 [Kwoniella pini CBS 10737]|uniref:Uncharacterized protein n=1 Tax=Kwoniella pini CBS 10737 TaxID=1296096 RepID=A0A1B9I4C2_9TREE|nr:uncharacterized protein I206_03696 [Kwoniella pini CBS 10737]OCF50375.1 hypothetical protein I206_03696 [Kwoniella pini CBS 10737]